MALWTVDIAGRACFETSPSSSSFATFNAQVELTIISSTVIRITWCIGASRIVVLYIYEALNDDSLQKTARENGGE
jgi:hypothetical protein